MAEGQSVSDTIKNFILTEFLPGEDPNELTETTPLVTGGILDSITTLRLVTFLEQEFKIQVEPHEADVDHLNTIVDIRNLVDSKLT